MTYHTGPEYITHCRSLGFSDPEIRAAMVKIGWQEMDLNTAFSQTEHNAPAKKRLSTKLLWIILGIVGALLLVLIGLAAYVLVLA